MNAVTAAPNDRDLWIDERLVVRTSPIEGQGLFASEAVPAATVVIRLGGRVVSSAELDRMFDATVRVISEAISAQRGVPIDQLKAAKVAAMRVHGRAGEACPVCGDTIRDFSFASTTAQYCPTCQTRGELLPLRSA